MSKTFVERFQGDADIQRHMLTPEDHGGKAIYGLNTHKYDFSEVAEQQFWEWHFRNEREANQAALDEHEAKTAEFNRLIAERKVAILGAKPAVELVGEPMEMGYGKWVHRVRMLIGAGPGPLDYWWLGFRKASNRHMGIEGYSKWRTDKRAHNLPHEWAVTHLERGETYDFAVIGGNRHGRVASDPVSAAYEAQPEPAAPEPATAPEPASERVEVPAMKPDLAHEHRFSGTWGNAWHKFPGIAPGRNYGAIADAAFTLPNGDPGLVTAIFHTDSRTLRLTLDHGTDSDQFPDEVWVDEEALFAAPGGMQKFGLGHARDYSLKSGSSSRIRVGGRGAFVLAWF